VLWFYEWVCRTCGKWQNNSPVIAKEGKAVLSVYIAAKDVLATFHCLSLTRDRAR